MKMENGYVVTEEERLMLAAGNPAVVKKETKSNQ